jgi:hypothetical protein
MASRKEREGSKRVKLTRNLVVGKTWSDRNEKLGLID